MAHTPTVQMEMMGIQEAEQWNDRWVVVIRANILPTRMISVAVVLLRTSYDLNKAIFGKIEVIVASSVLGSVVPESSGVPP